MSGESYKRAALPNGFSLLSVTTTILIVSVLSGLAVPSFMSTIKYARMSSTITSVSQSLRIARSEATKRKTGVSICALNSTGSCGANDWSSGWLIYTDSRSDGVIGVLDGADTIISNTQLNLNGIEIVATQLGNAGFTASDQLRFNSRGQSSWITGTFQVCDTADKDKHALPQAMILTAAGTFRNIVPTEDADGAQIVLDPAGDSVCG